MSAKLDTLRQQVKREMVTTHLKSLILVGRDSATFQYVSELLLRELCPEPVPAPSLSPMFDELIQAMQEIDRERVETQHDITFAAPPSPSLTLHTSAPAPEQINGHHAPVVDDPTDTSTLPDCGEQPETEPVIEWNTCSMHGITHPADQECEECYDSRTRREREQENERNGIVEDEEPEPAAADPAPAPPTTHNDVTEPAKRYLTACLAKPSVIVNDAYKEDVLIPNVMQITGWRLPEARRFVLTFVHNWERAEAREFKAKRLSEWLNQPLAGKKSTRETTPLEDRIYDNEDEEAFVQRQMANGAVHALPAAGDDAGDVEAAFRQVVATTLAEVGQIKVAQFGVLLQSFAGLDADCARRIIAEVESARGIVHMKRLAFCEAASERMRQTRANQRKAASAST